MPKMTEGFFMRAESFYNFASYLDGVSDFTAYGGKSLHHQSHGESFLALFQNRKENPRHLSLHFQKIGDLWSARVGGRCRVPGHDVPDGIKGEPS
jgi:hypothetical protein